LKDLFSRWGLPSKIITDNGKQFVSKQIEDFFTNLGITHSRTALYHPQSNGAVERFNRFLTDQLRLARVEHKPVDEVSSQLYRHTAQLGTARLKDRLQS
jgi:transposase InsO family protein